MKVGIIATLGACYFSVTTLQNVKTVLNILDLLFHGVHDCTLKISNLKGVISVPLKLLSFLLWAILIFCELGSRLYWVLIGVQFFVMI